MSGQVNRDSEFCGSLPLHLINNIQPYGILIVLELQSLRVLQVSGNIEKVTGTVADSIVGISASQLFNDGTALAELQSILDGSVHVKLPYTLSINNQEFLAIAHHTGPYLMLELEQVVSETAPQRSFVHVFSGLKYAMANMEAASDINSLCGIALRELKKTSGFDRIMVYQFDDNWDGTVIAETLEEGMEPYLGLRFPASDVPRGARELYQKNPYRLIPDCNYEPVKIYPIINPATDSFIDLSYCNLRGVAGVHLEYLRNMGVTASMSLRILHEGKLWGLISCHHRRPYNPSVEVCSAMELLSSVLASRISALERLQVYQFSTAMQRIQASLIEQLYRTGNMAESLLQHNTTILEMLHLDGAAVVDRRTTNLVGSTPAIAQTNNVVLWYEAKGLHGVYATSNCSDDYEAAKDWGSDVCGMIIIPVQAGKRNAYIIGFRKEHIAHVAWGGNPEDTIQFEPDGKKYHPRASFSIWKQMMTGRSQPWEPAEIAIADLLRANVSEWMIKEDQGHIGISDFRN